MYCQGAEKYFALIVGRDILIVFRNIFKICTDMQIYR
jgi:hypothetical protein